MIHEAAKQQSGRALHDLLAASDESHTGARMSPERCADLLDKLVELCYNGWSNAEIAEELGCTDRVVRYRKAQLGLTWLQQTPWLPACDLLEEWWRLNPGITTSALAIVLGLSSTTLRRHMRRVGFRPSAGRLASNKELLRAVKIIKARKVMFSLGRTFMEGALRNEFRMCATDRQIRDALRTVDPVGSRKRAKQAGKARRSYSVAGPRSLYHADAHEKIARLGPRRAFVPPMFLVARPPPYPRGRAAERRKFLSGGNL